MNKNDLLLQMYACAEAPSHWSRVLDQLCAETGACSAGVQMFGYNAAGVHVDWVIGDTQTMLRSPSNGMHITSCNNPRFDRHRVNRALNRVVRDDEIFDRHEPARDSLRKDLACIGLGDFMGVCQVLPDGRILGIGLHRALGDRKTFSTSAESRLAALAPHMTQACELGNRLLSTRAETQRLQQHADMLRCSLIACDAQARVQWMNHSALVLTSSDRGLLTRDCILRARNATLSARLHEDIAAAARDGSGAVRFTVIDNGAQSLHIALRARCTEGNGTSSVMLAVTGAQDVVDVPAEVWAKLLGLTLAEGRIVSALAHGDTVESYAGQRGIALGTARNQLKGALAKTSTSRQTDLVRVALSSAAAQVLR